MDCRAPYHLLHDAHVPRTGPVWYGVALFRPILGGVLVQAFSGTVVETEAWLRRARQDWDFPIEEHATSAAHKGLDLTAYPLKAAPVPVLLGPRMGLDRLFGYEGSWPC